MDDLKPYAVFAETVAAGSMSAAGRRLGLSPSAVSQTLRALIEWSAMVDPVLEAAEQVVIPVIGTIGLILGIVFAIRWIIWRLTGIKYTLR